MFYEYDDNYKQGLMIDSAEYILDNPGINVEVIRAGMNLYDKHLMSIKNPDTYRMYNAYFRRGAILEIILEQIAFEKKQPYFFSSFFNVE